MKRFVKFATFAVVTAASAVFASCSKNDDPMPIPEPGWSVITFDNMPSELMAGPSSYGENLYSDFENSGAYKRFTSYDYADLVTIGINEAYGSVDFWNGGVAVSNWNIRSDIDGKEDGWWYTYFNQCSVYNVKSADGKNAGAGLNGSNNFAVVNSSQLGNDSPAVITFAGGAHRIVAGLYVCNTAYNYGVMTKGNAYANSLVETKGYLELVVRGYKAGATVPSGEDRILLADYRGGNSNIIDTWTVFDFTNIVREPVNRLEFFFEGSDVGEWGLNTPTYVCIDDLWISSRDYSKQ